MRLQVLELPYDPEAVERPYILVISECTGDPGNYSTMRDKADFKACAGVIVTDQQVEVGMEWPPQKYITGADAAVETLKSYVPVALPETQELPVPKPSPYPVGQLDAFADVTETSRHGG